jgi:hypothetical protein
MGGAKAPPQDEVFRRFGVRALGVLEADAGRALFAEVVREVFGALADLAVVLMVGSPVAAFSTSPPPSRAISDSRRLETAERGISWATSTVGEAKESRCLINNQEVLELLP